MASPIVRLPTEIHDMILKDLDRESLLKVRATCKVLNLQATAPAFKRLHVWLEEGSLQNLVNIANDLHLHKCVKHIDFGTDLFYEVFGAQFWQHVFYRFIGRHRHAFEEGTSEAAHAKSAWHTYRKHYMKQYTLEITHDDLIMFAYAIEAFPALECIRLAEFQPHVDGSNEGSKLLEKKSLRPAMVNATSAWPPVPVGGHQLRILIRALAASSGRKLENLYLQIYTADMSKDGFFSPLSAKDANFAKSAFSGLKRLTLSLPSVCFSNRFDWIMNSTESSITTILKTATELEDLRIQFLTIGRSMISKPSTYWHDLIQTTCFGKLKNLSIEGGILNEAAFATFLIQSCQVLQKLNVSGVIMVQEGSWDLIFETIRSLPELADLSLERLWCGRYNNGFLALDGITMDPEPIYDYLLKRRSDNPWHSMCQAYIAKRDE